MKKLFLLFIIIAATQSKIFATHSKQFFTVEVLKPEIAQDTPKLKMSDYVTVQAAKLLLVIDKKAIPMTADVEMSNGTRVRTDGTLVKPDGKTFTLNEGDKVYGSGIIEAPKIQ